jgi:hypothetical protein
MQEAGSLGDPDVSFDGSRVAYRTGGGQIAVRDLAAGTTALASVSAAGQPAADVTQRPAISADGRVVSFDAGPGAGNLVPGDLNNAADVVVRDLAAGTTSLASVATDGTAPGGATASELSGDGRYVLFSSQQRLDPVDDANAVADVYRRDRLTGTTALVSARNGVPAAGSTGGEFGAISADGSRAAFESASPDLVAGDTNGASDVFVRDLQTGVTTRVSTGAGGAQSGAGRASGRAALSANGGLAGFTYDDGAPSLPLVPGDGNGLPDVFAKQLVPTDVTGPAIAVAGPDGVRVDGPQATLQGTVSDPSGVVAAALDGAALTLGPGGGFSVRLNLSVGANTVAITARDGSGNASSVLRTIVRPQALGQTVPAAMRVRATRLRARLSGRRLTVRFSLTGAGSVQVQLLRPQVRPTRPPRTTYRRLAKVLRRNMRPGARVVVLKVPKLTSGRYQVRVVVSSPGGVTQAVAALQVGLVAKGKSRR